MSENGYQAYEGSEPFVFVSYAHADTQQVTPLIRGLQSRGFRVWYDAGIHAGLRWNKVIVEHLNRSGCVLCLLSGQYVASDNCKQELYYAKKKRMNLVIGHLEQFELPAELEMELVLLHQEFADQYQSTEEFLDKLALSPVLQSCRGAQTPRETEHETEQLLREAALREQSWAMPDMPDMPDAPGDEQEEQEDPEAFFAHGTALFNRNEPAEGVLWYRKAAELGHVRAQCNLGLCYIQGRGVKPDPVQALRWFRAAAEQNDALAQFHTGLCYDKGMGTEPDPAEAAAWYESAAKQGHARAQSLIAACYAAGRGVEQDLEQSVKWYELAAEQGDTDAQFNAGFCYDRGKGVAVDPVRAVRWYSRAAQKDPRAMFNLGKCLEQGRGAAKDVNAAVNLYTRAAGMDHHAAQYRLSQCYREGIGVKKDRRKADFWQKKSQER